MAGRRSGEGEAVVLKIGPRGSLLGEGALKDMVEGKRKRELEQVFFGCNIFRKARTGTSMKQRAVVAKGMLEEKGVENQVRKLEEECKEDAEREEMMKLFKQVSDVVAAGVVWCSFEVCADRGMFRPQRSKSREPWRKFSRTASLGSRQRYSTGAVSTNRSCQR